MVAVPCCAAMKAPSPVKAGAWRNQPARRCWPHGHAARAPPTPARTRVCVRVQGELGFFWATKIGGPSHGFDLEGQCLLPLLANARHKARTSRHPRHSLTLTRKPEA